MRMIPLEEERFVSDCRTNIYGRATVRHGYYQHYQRQALRFFALYPAPISYIQAMHFEWSITSCAGIFPP